MTAPRGKYIAYYRTSTDLGRRVGRKSLDAQRVAFANYLTGGSQDWEGLVAALGLDFVGRGELVAAIADRDAQHEAQHGAVFDYLGILALGAGTLLDDLHARAAKGDYQWPRLRGELVAEFTEVEGGTTSARPELAKALAACKRRKATLVIAQLGPLARNVPFVSGLMKTKVAFVACDLPDVTPVMLHNYAVVAEHVAEHEARAVSARTKVALAAAKARGVQLGVTGRTILAPKARAEAKARAMEVAPVVRDLLREGLSEQAVANALNARSVPTPRGGKWHRQSVRRILQRAT